MYVKVEPSGCCERHGLVQVRFSFYLEPGDSGYEKNYVQIPKKKYNGKCNEIGIPLDIGHYLNWKATCPKIWVNTPFHNHFVYDEPETPDDEILAQMQYHLPNFYEAWCEDWGEHKGSMRRGWDDKLRIRPLRYDKIESLDAYNIRKVRCNERVEAIKNILSPVATNEMGLVFPVGSIDIGEDAIDRGAAGGLEHTMLDIGNPANDNGTIAYYELWFVDSATEVYLGTMDEAASPDYTPRDSEVGGAVTSGSKQSFSGLDIDVSTGDFAALFCDDGRIELDTSGGSGVWYKAGNQFSAGQQTYATAVAHSMSIYGLDVAPVAYGPYSGSVAIGTVATASSVKNTPASGSTIIGVVATASTIWNAIRSGSVIIGVVATATTLWNLVRSVSVIVGVKTTATGVKNFIRSTSTIVGVKATASRVWNRLASGSVIIGVRATARWWGKFSRALATFTGRDLGTTTHRDLSDDNDVHRIVK